MSNQKAYNPAQEGIDAARADARKIKLVEEMISQFSNFVTSEMHNGTMVNLDDVNCDEEVLEFLKAAMEVFVAESIRQIEEE